MTLIQAIDQARALLNEPLNTARTFPDNTSSFWTDNIMIGYHNLIQSEIQQELIQADENYFVTQTSITFVAGTGNYTLPTDLVKIRRVEDLRGDQTNPLEIAPVKMSERDKAQRSIVDTNPPLHGGYYLVGNQIHFIETPTNSLASAVRLFYVQRLTDVSAGSNSSEIPAEYHPILVWGIVKNCLFQQQADTSMADKEYNSLMSKMKKQAESRQIQRPRKVSIRNGRGW